MYSDPFYFKNLFSMEFNNSTAPQQFEMTSTKVNLILYWSVLLKTKSRISASIMKIIFTWISTLADNKIKSSTIQFCKKVLTDNFSNWSGKNCVDRAREKI